MEILEHEIKKHKDYAIRKGLGQEAEDFAHFAAITTDFFQTKRLVRHVFADYLRKYFADKRSKHFDQKTNERRYYRQIVGYGRNCTEFNSDSNSDRRNDIFPAQVSTKIQSHEKQVISCLDFKTKFQRLCIIDKIIVIKAINGEKYLDICKLLSMSETMLSRKLAKLVDYFMLEPVTKNNKKLCKMCGKDIYFGRNAKKYCLDCRENKKDLIAIYYSEISKYDKN